MATKSKDKRTPLGQAVGGIIGFILGFAVLQIYFTVLNALIVPHNIYIGLAELVVAILIYVGVMTSVLSIAIAEGGKDVFKLVFGICGLAILPGLVNYWILNGHLDRHGKPTTVRYAIATVGMTIIIILFLFGVVFATRF